MVFFFYYINSILTYYIAQISDNLRKVRTTARFLLGNLHDFKEEHYVEYDKLQDVSNTM